MDFQAIFKTTTIRQSIWTIMGTGVNGALGAGFYFLLARWLGSFDYGAFSLVTIMISGVAAIVDLGCDQAVVRFIPHYHQDSTARAQVMKLALEIKVIMGVATIGVFLLAAKPLGTWVFKAADLSYFVPLAGVGVLSQLLFTYVVSLSQALERFAWWSAILVGTNLVRLVIVTALFGIGSLNSSTTVLAYITTPFLGFMAAWLVSHRNVFWVQGEWRRLREFWHFNPGVVAFTLVAVIGSRIDTLLTARLIDLSAVGVYSLANQITSILPQLTVAIGAVTSPKYASFTSAKLNLSYTFKALQLTSGLGAVAALAIVPLAGGVIYFSGVQYYSAWEPLGPLLAAMFVFLATSPLRDSIIYYFGKPNFFTVSGIVHTLLMVGLGLWWIPIWGIRGAAYSVLVGQLAIAVMVIGYYWYKHTTEVA